MTAHFKRCLASLTSICRRTVAPLRTPKMKLHCKKPGAEYQFHSVPLSFQKGVFSDLFGKKNNKTVRETLAHPKYASLRDATEAAYPSRLREPLGSFLLDLKQNGDDFYRRFLNPYGDLEYSIFQITDKSVFDKCGVYAYKAGGELCYIGRCRNALQKRINQGYGKIHPKNCYRDGQITNCRLNALITMGSEAVSFWFCELASDKIIATERCLIDEYQLRWNI